MASPVKIGMVGYGFGGRYFHVPLITSTPGCELIGVVTTSAERRALIAREWPGTPTFGSLADLVDAGAEAVAISTPAGSHTELTDDALRSGLAVVCDKPFALDAVAARATVALADELALALSPYQNRRWDADFLTVRALVSQGALGEVTRFESRFERFAPDSGPPASGGGTLLDFGSHLVDQALVLLGPVASVYAEWRVRASLLDDDVFVALTHGNGARSHLWGSWAQSAPGPRYRVTGTAGTYVIAAGDTQEDALVAGQTPASLGERWGLEPAGAAGTLYRGLRSEAIPTVRGGWDSFYPAFALAVRDPAIAPPVDPRDAIATAVVLDAARLSAVTGAVVAVGQVQ